MIMPLIHTSEMLLSTGFIQTDSDRRCSDASIHTGFYEMREEQSAERPSLLFFWPEASIDALAPLWCPSTMMWGTETSWPSQDALPPEKLSLSVMVLSVRLSTQNRRNIILHKQESLFISRSNVHTKTVLQKHWPANKSLFKRTLACLLLTQDSPPKVVH